MNDYKIGFIRLNWIYNDGDEFVNFCKILQHLDQAQLYENKFIKNLVMQFWDTHGKNYYRYVLYQFYAYVTLAIIYFCVFLDPMYIKAEFTQENALYFIVYFSLLATWAVQVVAEILQFSEGRRSYFLKGFNYFDILQLPFLLLI